MWKKPENPFGAKELCTQLEMNGKQGLGNIIPIKGLLPLEEPHNFLWGSSLRSPSIDCTDFARQGNPDYNLYIIFL
jgi:hypothetical protein